MCYIDVQTSRVCDSPFYLHSGHGACVGEPKSNAFNLILRQYVHFKAMFWYFFTYNKWETEYTTQTHNNYHHHGDGAPCPSSGMDSLHEATVEGFY